jgi:PhzF family phenazine biosynthesis protein
VKLPIFQLDAFTSKRFGGNPASVVILDEWLPDATLQAIAAENNHPETAFVVPRREHFDLRWFTPQVEMDLCGHATLAAAHVLLHQGYAPGNRVVFHYGGGTLEVEPDGERLAMDFPARMPVPVTEPAEADRVARALRARPREVHRSRDLMAVFERQADVAALDPDFAAVAALDAFAVIATAPGDDCDFVSRFFAPGAGVPEDPVTGSAHCTLVPWWSRRLGRRVLHARQLSPRGGELHCEDRGERVRLAGRVVEYLRGEIEV